MTDKFAETLKDALIDWMVEYTQDEHMWISKDEGEVLKKNLKDYNFNDIEAWVDNKTAPKKTEEKDPVIERLDEVIRTLEEHRNWMQGLQKQIDEATNQ